MKASVIIANYNNARFIKDCINSLKTQTYENIEIIFFDDNSSDNSIEVIEKFKNIKIIKNNIQTEFGSLNQINAFKKGIELSSGDIIFLLDSDDFFHKNKIERIIKLFVEDDKKNIIFDYPIILTGDKEIYQNNKTELLQTYWGYIHPTSCISLRKKFINNVLEATVSETFTNIWLDLRILLFSKYVVKYNVIKENLTYYRQTEENISSKFKKYSKKWWNRRNEAHEYYIDFMSKNKIKTKKNLDYYITKIINRVI